MPRGVLFGSSSLRQWMQGLRWSIIADLGLLAAIPLVQAMINDDWLFSPIGWYDPWYYLGYALNYADPTFLNDYYKISRLPWIFAEIAARNLCSPTVASWILQIGTLALGSSSLYLLFTRTLGRSIAFLAAAVFAAFPFAHSSGGADYHNTLAGPLYAMSWWLAIRCAELGETRARLFWLGVVLALTFHSCIVFAGLLPVLLLHYVWAYRDAHRCWPPIFKTLIPLAAGGIAITIVLGVINVSVGRDFLFFMLQFNLAASFAGDSSLAKTWWLPWSSGWLWTAQYLGVLAAALLVALITLIAANRQKPKHTQAMMYSAGYILAVLSWVLWQTQGQVTLSWVYFAYPLAFPFSGAVAASFAYWARADRPLHALAKLTICAMLIGVLAYSGHINEEFRLFPAKPFSEALIVGLVYGFCVICIRNQMVRFWGGAAALAVCIAYSNNWYQSYVPASCPLPRFGENAIDASHRFIRAAQRSLSVPFNRVFLWADNDELMPVTPCAGRTIDLMNFEHSLAFTGFNHLEPPWGSPNVEGISEQRLKEVAFRPNLIVYVTARPERVDQLMRRFGEVGAAASEKEFQILDTGALKVPIYTFTVHGSKQS